MPAEPGGEVRQVRPEGRPGDPEWYRDAIIYQLHVKAFQDSDGDGIGDFRGLTSRLDYLQDLGVTALWLLPFYPSPLRDDGYDIADYRDVHSSYGTLEDFRAFLEEAHRRGLRVITELVINHTSDQHPWFQRARRAEPGSPERDWYVWSDTPDRYADARIIFKDFESSNWTWDPVAEAYYWHRFYSHQPDLNFDRPAVGEAVMGVMDYWLEMGVDGLRLDAVPYLFEREGTNCENLPETHDFLRRLRARVDEKYGDRMLLAEANQWPEDAVEYFGDGDECHMAFHFPIMPRLFMGIRMEDRFPILDILEQTPEIPESSQWAVFLRNHDELTLEMVTDEERDYMYRMYASDSRARINLGIRRRLAPLLDNNRKKMELMIGLLFSLPGTPVLYYGDEIGMGDNIYLGDRNGVRTPMQWSGDRNAGFSTANPQKLYLPVITDPEYRYEAINVESQRHNPSSLLWWVRRILALRKRFRAFGRGSLTPVRADNAKVLAFLREFEDERLLLVFNLSRFVQAVQLDLSEHRGAVPEEIFGGSPFPTVGEWPYLLTLGPHAFYWFELKAEREVRREQERLGDVAVRSTLEVSGPWYRALEGRARETLEEALPDYLRTRRWFGGKARRIRHARIHATVPLPWDGGEARIAIVRVSYLEGDGETYTLPLTYATGDRADVLVGDHPGAVLCRLRIRENGNEEGVLYDAALEPAFNRALLELVRDEGQARGEDGHVQGWRTQQLDRLWPEDGGTPEPAPIKAEQSNTSIIYEDHLILKLFRRLESGLNPDVEISRALSEAGFAYTPPVAGGLDLVREGETLSAAILQGYVENEGDAWDFTRDALSRYFERVVASGVVAPGTDASTPTLLRRARAEPLDLAREMLGLYLEAARRLGQRTAELHDALAGLSDPDFSPEPFSTLYQRSLYQSMRNSAGRTFRTLEARIGSRPPGEVRDDAAAVLDLRDEILSRFRRVTEGKFDASRIRIHGDYHLGQVLHTGKDFLIIDFEGEPARPIGERRLKRSPLRDVAGMIRSFHYAAYVGLRKAEESGVVGEGEQDGRDRWARFWYAQATASFLGGYVEHAEEGLVLPRDAEDLEALLDAYLLEKALYEVGYELNNRPDWVWIPARGVLELMRPTGEA